jgi:hypothetical protein
MSVCPSVRWVISAALPMNWLLVIINIVTLLRIKKVNRVFHSFPHTWNFFAEPLSTTRCERRSPNARLTPVNLGSHMWVACPKTLSLPLPGTHACWSTASTARCPPAQGSHSDPRKLLWRLSSVCVGSGGRRCRARRRPQQLMTVMGGYKLR